MGKMKQKRLKLVCGMLGFVLVLVAACTVYLCDYYQAEPAAVEAFASKGAVEMQTTEDGDLVFAPKGATVGFIFYPGGKVEHLAYIPLMRAMAEKGILCVLVKMPFRLAVLDSNAAEGIQKQHPQIENWYIGGHSLGGSMAAAYAATCPDDFEGLALLGSYSTTDLSETDMKVLSVYGSEDKVLNRENYEENKKNLPKDFAEIVLEGGCHAYFGMYGAQEGDGIPILTNEEQIAVTADALAALTGSRPSL